MLGLLRSGDGYGLALDIIRVRCGADDCNSDFRWQVSGMVNIVHLIGRARHHTPVRRRRFRRKPFPMGRRAGSPTPAPPRKVDEMVDDAPLALSRARRRHERALSV